MNPQEVVSVIREIAQLLEPGAQEAWALAVRQTMINGWIGATLGGALFLVALVALLWALFGSHDYDDEAHYGVGIAAMITAPALLIWGIVGLQQLLNPEWYAIQLLLRLVKGG